MTEQILLGEPEVVATALVVRYEAAAVGDIDMIRATRIATPGGAQIPLSSLAEIRKDRGPNTISRERMNESAGVGRRRSKSITTTS